MTTFHPDLHRRARFIPRFSFGPRIVAVMRWVNRRMRPPRLGPGVSAEWREVPGPDGPLQVRIYRPDGLSGPAPALLWIHGGGFIVGTPLQDERGSAAFAKELGIVVVAVKYRLAPEHPYPAPLEDCYAALRWLHANASALGVRADRIAIGGASAGGGLTAGLALLARDRGEVPLAFQLLVYPMLDDRTAARDDIDETDLRLWNQRSNRLGWRSYLGRDPGADGVAYYAAPARCEQLAGLPPAWLGVGTFDLFHAEDLAYARRLQADGVPCAVEVIPGAYHGFDAISRAAAVSRAFRRAQVEALRAALVSER